MATRARQETQRRLTLTGEATDSDWVDVQTAAALCSVGKRCIRGMVERGEVQSRKFGRYLRIWRASLQPDAPEAATRKTVLGLAKTRR